MRQVLLNSRGAVVARVPRPIVEPGTVLVRTRYSLISVGTEVASLRPAGPPTAPEQPATARLRVARTYLTAALRDPRRAARKVASLVRQRVVPGVGSAIGAPAPQPTELDQQGWNVGYSLAGEVVAAGEGVTDLAPGDLVACAGAGQANHADYVAVPRNLTCRVPAGCPVDAAAFGTVGAIALQGVRRAAPQLAEVAAVIGLGLIGQMTVQLLRASGCRVIGLDLSAARVERARRAGLDDGTADPETFKRLVRDASAGHGADRTLVTAAARSSEVVNLAMHVTRRRGAVVLVGDVGLDIKRDEFYRKEIDLLMSTSYGPGRYDRAYEIEGHDYPYPHVRWTLNRNIDAFLRLAAEGRVDVISLIDRVVPVNEAETAYAELARSQEPPLGVLLSYPDDARELPEPADSTRVVVRGHRPAPEGPAAYALVGAGAFGTSMLVPQMARRPDALFLKAVVSRRATQAGNFARANGIEVVTSNLEDVLRDQRIELVVIATRHHEHARQTAQALRAGKHVFVEKPLALTWEELDEVTDAHREAPGSPVLMVGFNRRFSPALQALAGELSRRRAPLVINYRVNAGFIPPDHWIQGPEGGGRNLGEACHMYDVFRMLAAAPVSELSAHAISADPPYRPNDNFSATMKYADGTVATLVYTASGPRAGLPKERIEVFCAGEAFVVDDFRRVVRASDDAVLWKSEEADKGHCEELSRLADAVRGGPAPIPFDELVETSAVALHVEDALFGRVAADAADS